MESKIVLTKESSSSDLESYFRGVLELYKQRKEYPVNLDEVWQLCYAEKGKAVRALKTNFIEYQYCQKWQNCNRWLQRG